MSLNYKQGEAFKRVLSGENLFIGGSGGVGKSFLVRHIIEKLGDSTVLLGPTGIAALNIGGATIHSVFKFPLGILTKRDMSRVHQKVHDLFDKKGPVKRIIIDEISMVRSDLFKAIDQQLRKARRLNVPFGGLQVIVVGDFYQLPPVVTRNEKKHFFSEYRSQFAFSGDTWVQGQFSYIELDEIMRQSDEVFINHLQNIRKKTDNYVSSVNFFNYWAKRNTESVLENDPVFLCTVNKTADTINDENYEELDEEEKVFYGTVSGKFPSRPSPENLKLKYGTKVLFTANDKDGQFKNGEVGYVIGFIGDKIQVVKEDTEEELLVSKNTWEERDYTIGDSGGLQSFPIGKYTQYPLKHGWAVTIHKSQGMSLDNAVLQMGQGCFASGQLYVALSRLRTLEGMGLIDYISEADVIVDPQIQRFYDDGCVGEALLGI